MAFAYASGSRPIEPYTIKHALGCGGFGEVYYAVSEAGKEVALKHLCREPEIELRGIRVCLNLSHPHLVSIYDLRRGTDGSWWLVMEYVGGPTLSALLQQHAQGLLLDRVARWMQQLAEALDFLHEHGIVHRDLKPSNIFLADCYPDGWVKVGDYGLSKLVTGRQGETHSAIGTVYYMAPEMARGRYDASVDVYAAGVIAYQLLCGRLPFVGQSVQEIFLRHLTDEPDWSRIPAAAVPVLRTALAKDPAARFATVGELAQQLRQAASSTGQLSLTAGQDGGLQSQQPSPSHHPDQTGQRPRRSFGSGDTTTIIYRPGGRVAEFTRSWLGSVASGLVLTAFLAIIGWNLRSDIPGSEFVCVGSFALLGAWALLALQRLWWDERWPEVWLRCLVRMVLGMSLGMLGAWLAGAAWLWDKPALPTLALQEEAMAYSLAHRALRDAAFFGLLFLLTPWEHLMRPQRNCRFSWNPVILITFLAGTLVWFWERWEPIVWEQAWPKLAVVALVAVLVQLASPVTVVSKERSLAGKERPGAKN